MPKRKPKKVPIKRAITIAQRKLRQWKRNRLIPYFSNIPELNNIILQYVHDEQEFLIDAIERIYFLDAAVGRQTLCQNEILACKESLVIEWLQRLQEDSCTVYRPAALVAFSQPCPYQPQMICPSCSVWYKRHFQHVPRY